MIKKKFLYDRSDDQNSQAKLPCLYTFYVYTSWEESAVQKIEDIANGHIEDLDLNSNNVEPYRITSSFHYAKTIIFLLGFWRQQEKHDRKDIIFSVGRFSIQLQASDLYCCPVKKTKNEMGSHYRNLSYPTMKPSKKLSKHYSETLWNYIKGNHDKVESYVQTSQDATAICAILFSEVIRYPDMFFHNILLMECYKTWNEFCDYHPMVTGGSWKCQDEDVPKKVKKREQKNLLYFAEKIMRNEEKRDTLFQITYTQFEE
ncbi:uncharacterized protein si:dkey-211g8.8 [Pseudorasbora parva]|uniref:uncharacterized protein si:dkey-211g8.8 n=1 Tax=Pseudorasbora parva TaxID=51549 RepID=UPI00351DB27B